MHRTIIESVAICALIALTSACGEISVAPTDCTPGDRLVCDCPGGTIGIQECTSAGKLAVCECGDAGGGSDADAAAEDAVDSGTPDVDASAEDIDASVEDVEDADTAVEDVEDADAAVEDADTAVDDVEDAADQQDEPDAPLCPPGTDCDDGDPCTVGDTCKADGVTCAGVVKDCDDGVACTLDSCDAATGECGHEAGGACVADSDCDDGNPCTLDSCDTASCACMNVVDSNATCSDGDPCTGPDVCMTDGSCGTTGPVDCDDGDACTVDSCGPSGCEATAIENVAAASFDGNSCMQVMDVFQLGAPLSPLTFELWIRPSSGGPGQQRIMDAWNGQGVRLVRANDDIEWQAGQQSYVIPNVLDIGSWTHLAFVLDASAGVHDAYVDGQPAGSFPISGQPPTADEPWLGLGCIYTSPSPGGSRFEGDMDEVRFSTVARYSGPFVPSVHFEPDADTLVLLHFDEQALKNPVDASPQGFTAEWDGTPQGSYTTDVPQCVP